MKLTVRGDKLITVSGKLTNSDDCCCVTCELAGDCNCAHSICLDFRLDTGDTSNQNIFDANSGSDGGILGMWYEGGALQIYTWDDGANLGPITFDAWHSIRVELCVDDTGKLQSEWFLDGVSSATLQVLDFDETEHITDFDFGARFGSGNKHRAIRNVQISNNNSDGFTGSFPPFDSLIGAGISIDGEGSLRIDDDTNSDSYATEAITESDLKCCDYTLVCDSISASATKCGYSPFHKSSCVFPFSDLGYGTTFDFTNGCRAGVNDCASSLSGDSDPDKLYATQTFTISGTGSPGTGCDCNASVSGTATFGATYNLITCEPTSFGDDESTAFSCDTPELSVCCECDQGGGHDPCRGPLFPPECTGVCRPVFSFPVNASGTLTDEVTTDYLISQAVAALPDYDDDFNDTCSASRDLAEDESTVTIQRFKYKFTFVSPPANGLKICWNEHFVPDVGDPIDTPRSFTFNGVVTETTTLEVTEPDEDGEITITDISCTCP